MKKIVLTLSLLVCSVIGTVQATSLSYNGDGTVIGYTLDGIAPAGQPNFENDVSFAWDSTVKFNPKTGAVQTGKAKIVVTYVDGLFLFNDLGSHTVDDGGFTLEASLKYMQRTGEWMFQRGSLDITGAVTTSEGAASGGLLNKVRLTDWAYNDNLIGFNTVINGQTATICGIYDCSSNESVYISLADGLFNPLDYDTEGRYSYASDGLAVTTLAVTAIPLPAAVWFFGSGLIGLVALARRKRV